MYVTKKECLYPSEGVSFFLSCYLFNLTQTNRFILCVNAIYNCIIYCINTQYIELFYYSYPNETEILFIHSYQSYLMESLLLWLP